MHICISAYLCISASAYLPPLTSIFVSHSLSLCHSLPLSPSFSQSQHPIRLSVFPINKIHSTVSRLSAESVTSSLYAAFSTFRRHLRLYDTDVTVHVIEPSLFRTDMVDPERHYQLFQSTWRRLPQRTKDEFGETFYKECKYYLYLHFL